MLLMTLKAEARGPGILLCMSLTLLTDKLPQDRCSVSQLITFCLPEHAGR